VPLICGHEGCLRSTASGACVGRGLCPPTPGRVPTADGCAPRYGCAWCHISAGAHPGQVPQCPGADLSPGRALAASGAGVPRDTAAAARLSRCPQQFRRAPGSAGPEVAHDVLGALAQRWTDHQGASSTRIAHKRSACTGRPTPRSPLKALGRSLRAPSGPCGCAMREPHRRANTPASSSRGH
jgi:hypothetical protein